MVLLSLIKIGNIFSNQTSNQVAIDLFYFCVHFEFVCFDLSYKKG